MTAHLLKRSPMSLSGSFKAGSLCSGYGGLDLAVCEVFPGTEVEWFSEVDPAAVQVFKRHFGDPPCLGDIREVDWSTVEPVDIITAGYPCQPFSNAGKRGDYTKDDRHLWPYIYKAVCAVRPRLVFLENVAGHRNRGFSEVLGGLAAAGYDAQWVSVRASDIGAPHQRNRLFALAHANAGVGVGRSEVTERAA